MRNPTRILRFAGSTYSAPRRFARSAASAGVLALAVSCADGRSVTGPSAKSPDASFVKAHHAEVIGDVVVMHRSTVIAAHDGIARVNKNSTETIGSHVRSVAKDDGPIAASPQADFTAGVQPRPVVSLPARAETGMCAGLPAWSRAENAPDGRKMRVSGTGDAPASVVKITTDDGTLLTIERTWVRTSRTWQLARQVTTTSDKRYRDEVVYEHQSASGERIDRAIPIVACAEDRGPRLLSATAHQGFYLPHTNSVASRLFPLSGGLADYSCGASPTDCFSEQNAVYTADVALVAAATIAAYACTGVAIVVPAACVAAGVAWSVSVANLALAQRALNHCLYMLAHPGGVELQSAGMVESSRLLASGRVTGSALRILDTPPAVSADCGSGGLTEGGVLICHSEPWEISYDGGATWSYLMTVQVCENVL